MKQAILVVPEKTIGSSFNDEPLTRSGFWADWRVEPRWNLCNAPGGDNGGKVNALEAFLKSGDKALVCTHATFRFAVDKFGVDVFDGRLIGENFRAPNGQTDARLRVIYNNGTESNLLLRSLKRTLYKDDAVRRLTPSADSVTVQHPPARKLIEKIDGEAVEFSLIERIEIPCFRKDIP